MSGTTYRIQEISVFKDGTLVPSHILLGNQGDINTNQLLFDLSDLVPGFNLEGYEFKLSFLNPMLPSGTNNPQNFTITDSLYSFTVPETLTKMQGKYYLFSISLVERLEAGKISEFKEVWTSQEGTAFINQTCWNEDLEIQFPLAPVSDGYDSPSGNYIIKPPILTSLSGDSGHILSEQKEVGIQGDQYIRRIEFCESENTALFTEKWAVFETIDGFQIIKFKTITGSTNPTVLLTPILLMYKGLLKFSIIMATGNDATVPGYQRKISSPIEFFIRENILQTGEIPGLSNFITLDGDYVYTVDDNLFTVTE